MVRSFGTIGFGSETGLRSAGQNIPILFPISSYQAHHPINLLKRCLLSQMSAHNMCCNLNLSQTATMSGTQCPNAGSQDLNKISIKPPTRLDKSVQKDKLDEVEERMKSLCEQTAVAEVTTKSTGPFQCCSDISPKRAAACHYT